MNLLKRLSKQYLNSIFLCVLILSTPKTLTAASHKNTSKKDVFLVYGGKTGWIGQKIVQLLQEEGKVVYCSEARLEDRESLEKELRELKPSRVINAAGVTGRPNVDWCESNQQTTIRTNIIGTLNINDLAYLHKIHITNFLTGCIYEYDEEHPINSAIGFKETDTPNFQGSFYSKTKVIVEELLRSYPEALILRLRMPISADLHPRNFITKIINYKKVVNIPNSMSILDDLLPISIDMSKKKISGVFNFTNPGTISHNEILALYKLIINPSFTWTNFSLEEQSQILKAPRSNNELDVEKLTSLYPHLPHIKESIINVFQKMKESM